MVESLNCPRSNYRLNRQTKDLTQKIQTLLNKSTQQLMLSKIVNNPDFDKFLNGDLPVRVYTSKKVTFPAMVRASKTSQMKFRLEPRGIVPEDVQVGSILLLVFPSGNTQLIAQCVVESLSVLVIGIKPIDPRVDPRILTLLDAKLGNVKGDVFTKISSAEILTHRSLELSDSKIEAECLSCEDLLFTKNETNEATQDASQIKQFVDDLAPAIMTDISQGGCRLQLPKNNTHSITDASKLILVEFVLPMLTNRKASVLALIRQKRRHRESLVLHCMFLEKLPDGFLDV
jgi:hypothetical protein